MIFLLADQTAALILKFFLGKIDIAVLVHLQFIVKKKEKFEVGIAYPLLIVLETVCS